MLTTVRDACELHPMALEYALSEQIEHLSQLLDEHERDAEAFFEKNYVTHGMRELLRGGLQRLAGQSDQATFELRQAMGGGKTHSMLALGLLARNPHLRHLAPEDVTAGIHLPSTKVVAINGRAISDEIYIWGEIASQLDKRELFARFWRDVPKAPNEPDWIQLIGDEPVLILLDELPPYFEYAQTRQVGGGTLAQVVTFALANLLSAALKLPRCCIVISSLSGTYQTATAQLRQAIRNFEHEANRQARTLTPVDLASDEIYAILKKRLFRQLPTKDVINAIAASYAEALMEAVRSRSVAKTAQQSVDEIHLSYPFHPSVKHVVALFKENETYRQTRGLMQFVSKMLKSVWQRPTNDVHLIGCQHLDLNVPDVREEVTRISNLQGAIATDIAAGGQAHAELIDAHAGNDAASQAAALLLTASLSESVEAVKGLNERDLLECLISPGRGALEFQDAFAALRRDAWYLHRKENDAWYFANIENLGRRVQRRAEGAPQPKVDAEMKRRLEEIFQPERRKAYERVLALPKLEEIDLKGPRVCLVLSPDGKDLSEDAKGFYESVIEKNNLCIVTGDGSDLASLEAVARRIWATVRVREETGGDRSPHAAELEDMGGEAEKDFHTAVVSLFNRVYYPHRSGLASTRLAMTFTGKTSYGEEHVEKALADRGVWKLVIEVEAEADGLIQRAEEMLWPATERRVPWRDVAYNSITYPRWVWLPPRGLEQLRDIARGQGRWRWHEDGYIEKPPFPPAQTSVSVVERDYDADTGEATLLVTGREAGKRPRILYARDAVDLPDRPNGEIDDSIFKTPEVRLFFLAIDPDGTRETGEPFEWKNKLTIKHEPRAVVGKCLVELAVVPQATEIRWNTKGINPKDGEDGRPLRVDCRYRKAAGCRHASALGVDVESMRDATIEFDRPTVESIRRGPRGCASGSRRGSDEAFRLINRAKPLNIRLGGVILTIGDGTASLSARFGSDAVIAAEEVERFIAACRAALGDPAAEVRLTCPDIHFTSGHDLETLLRELGIETTPGEIEQ